MFECPANDYPTITPKQPGYGTVPATTFTYDGLGRVKTSTTSDSAITKTSYSGNQTTVIDPAQVTQTMTYDGLGRLTTLADAMLTTSYAYDGNSNMKQVTQGLQTRTFTYDSLNRLTSSINPESGTVLYTYDNVGNLIQRTDNRQIVTTNTYDALNRILQTTYTNPAGTLGTPTVTYTYDSGANANGQLTSVATSGVSTTSYTSFDVMGRFQKSTQTTGGQTFPFSYDYNYAGGLISEVYPSGRKITIGYDAANRQSAVNGMMNNQNTTYISSAGYAPNGGLVSYFTNNGLLTLNQLYNMHQQVSYVAVAQGNKYQSQNYFAQTMDWGSSNNNGVRLYGKNEYISNNAALPSAPTFSQTFSYDGVNRLLSASDTGGWSQTYSYDAYGNMWMPATSNPLPSLSGAAPTTNIYNASNQDPNVKYDGAGNQTSLGSLTLSYDGENRQSQIKNLGGGTATLQYDGLGHRVVKSLPSQTTTYVYDGFGQLAAEYSSGATPTPPCTTCFLTYDYLGNVRMVTDAQAKIIARHDFAPFGQEITSGTGGRGSEWGSTTDVDMKFTGQIRDQELGEDFFNARYFAFALGRFSSPDPGNAGASLGIPQSWNGYGYVLGNPLALTDLSGMFASPSGGGSGNPATASGGDNPLVFSGQNIQACWAYLSQSYGSYSAASSGLNCIQQFAMMYSPTPQTGGGGGTSTTQSGTPASAKTATPAPKTLSCQINSRAANIPFGQFLHSMGINHEWVTTSTGRSVGMGTARGVPQSDYPGVQTQVVDHTGVVPQSSTTFNSIDAAALNTYINAGAPTGPWIPVFNDCNTWANGVINNSTPHNITVTIYGVPVTIATGVVVYSDGSIHAPGGH